MYDEASYSRHGGDRVAVPLDGSGSPVPRWFLPRACFAWLLRGERLRCREFAGGIGVRRRRVFRAVIMGVAALDSQGKGAA